MTDSEFRRLNQRRGELIDRKYATGLTPEEATELAELTRQNEAHWAPFYAPIIARLERLLASRKGGGEVVRVEDEDDG